MYVSILESQRRVYPKTVTGDHQVDLGASEHLKTSRMGGQEGLNGLRLCEREAEAVFILEKQGNVEKYKKEKLI